MTYSIHESLIEKLEKKLTTIRNKCEKYGCEFFYERVGEEFKDIEDENGQKHTGKFIIVEASGLAIINDWRFVAVIEHKDSGNIIRQYDYNLDVPSKYRTTKPICEHCGTLRNRRDTCLVYNDTTGEWKQVGKSCLKDFTNGLDADQVARFMSYQDVLDEYNGYTFSGQSYRKYYPMKDILLYGVECVKHFGYVKSDSWDSQPTGSHTFDLYDYIEFGTRPPFRKVEDIENEIQRVGFKAITAENKAEVAKMIEWIISEDSSNNNYIHNLQVLVKSEYVTHRDINMLVSLVAAYRRHLNKVEQDNQRACKHEVEMQSKHVGNIKDKITVDVKSSQLVTSWDTQYGWSGMYKFTDNEGNIFIWITSCNVDTDKKMKLTGTVKEHSQFNGVNQTVLTRCKIQYIEESHEDNVHPEGTFDMNIIDVMYEEV